MAAPPALEAMVALMRLAVLESLASAPPCAGAIAGDGGVDGVEGGAAVIAAAADGAGVVADQGGAVQGAGGGSC